MLVSETSTIIMLLLYLIDFANSFPSFFLKPNVPLNEFIKHYEPALYDVKEVASQHKRIRRKAGMYEQNSLPLKLTISTSNRVFKLILRPDRSLFAEDVEFEGEQGRMVNFDPGTAYIGTLEDDGNTQVRGIITKDGLFDGTITTQFEEFYVEPVSRYRENVKSDSTHTIMYEISNVVQPVTPLCAVPNPKTKNKPTDLNIIAHRSKRKRRQTVLFEKNQNESFSYQLLISNNSSFSKHYIDELQKFSSKGTGVGEKFDDSWPKFRNLFPKKNHKSHIPFQPSHSDERYKFSYQSALLSSRSSVNQKLESADSVDHSVHADGAYYDLDLINVPSEMNLPNKKSSDVEKKNYEFNDDQFNKFKVLNTSVHESSSKHWRPKTSIIDSVHKYTNITKNSKGFLPPPEIIHKSNPKILIGSGIEDSHANLIMTGDDSLEQHARKRTIVDPRKTTCMLYLQADHLFYEKYGTEETCIEVMTRHVQRVNSIYRNTDFNQDGKPDNISFMIKRIKVHSVKDPSYRFPGNYGVEKFLELFSEEDYDAFCLAYMFTYRDFEMGTLGLAWTGDLKNAGGVCEKNGHYRGSLKSLNTGIVTVLNYGKHVPSAVSHVTLAHEIGHNFGSPHDPDGCTPGGDDGNFIMFARATSGDKKNNNRFSPCSLHAINPVLNAKARSAKGCFTETQTSICGNGVVEPGEECDCGWEEDCRDICCYPQRRYPSIDETPCRLTPKAICSPSQGPCCTTDCHLKVGDMCRDDNGCRDSSYCNGLNPQCPPSINKPNKTVCNEEYVCYMGECTGSICLAYGLESCQCIPTPSDPITKACELCCKIPGENQPCLSSFQWNHPPYDVPDMFAKPGTPCNDYNGYCDVFRKCREVDPSGPIATLKKLLLSEENIASFKKWAFDHWYYCGFIFCSFILLMIVSLKVLGKKSKVKTVTVVHSSPTETVRLPADGSGGQAVVVHPIVVHSKLPFKKKVHERKRRSKCSLKEETATPHNVNNNNSPIEVKKKLKRCKGTVKIVDVKLTKPKTKKSRKEGGVSPTKISANINEDAVGKVRNWLISNSHNMNGCGSLKKSRSSPANFDLSDNNGPKKHLGKSLTAVATTTATNATAIIANAETKKVKKKLKDTRVKLQVVYKPPFKFSVKLGRCKNEISSHLIKDRRSEAVKERTALFVGPGCYRGRTNGMTNANIAAKTVTATVNAVKLKNEKKMTKRTADIEKEETVRVKTTEYKRSLSAPPQQSPQPVYQNTVTEFKNSAEKSITEEPLYANVLWPAKVTGDAQWINPFSTVNDFAFIRNRVTSINSKNIPHKGMCGMKRKNSNDMCGVIVRQRSTSLRRAPSAKRCNSAVDIATAYKTPVKMPLVKKQCSDETEMKSKNLKPVESADLKYVNLPSSSTDDNYNGVDCAKPTHSQCTYDADGTNVFALSVAAAAKLCKRKTWMREEETANNVRDKEGRSHVRRSLSNNTVKNEGEKFKRYSLQYVDISQLARAEEKENISEKAAQGEEEVEMPFHEIQLMSEIPSDLEVLLSNVGNSGN